MGGELYGGQDPFALILHPDDVTIITDEDERVVGYRAVVGRRTGGGLVGAERTAEFLHAERERYEYLLACAKDAEHEELAWETIVAKMTVEDFVTAAKEVLAAREVIKAAPPPFLLRALADWFDSEQLRRGWTGDNVQRHLCALADALDAYGRVRRAEGHATTYAGGDGMGELTLPQSTSAELAERAIMEAWRQEARQRRRRGECPCPECLSYPNAEAARRWNANSRAAGWAHIGEPVPAGWRFEDGLGLTRTGDEWRA